MKKTVIIRYFPQVNYQDTWERMRSFTQNRTEDTPDELWLLQHPPVFTQGLAGKPEHLLFPGNIPVIQTDRGGQITYHGPGQLVVYILADLRRLNIGIRKLVTQLENSVVGTLADYNISALPRSEAPGVYVDAAKICSIGLRVKHGCSYHGIAFNINMDLTPFQRINPCGYANLPITQVAHFRPEITVETIEPQFISHLCRNFGYNAVQIESTRPEHEPISN